jgi:hypothetical protein
LGFGELGWLVCSPDTVFRLTLGLETDRITFDPSVRGGRFACTADKDLVTFGGVDGFSLI